MKRLNDPVSLGIGLTSFIPSATGVAAAGGALSGVAGLASAFNRPKAPKAPDPDKQMAKEVQAARTAAQKQRSLLASQLTTDTALQPLSTGPGPSGSRRSLLGV